LDAAAECMIEFNIIGLLLVFARRCALSMKGFTN